MLASSEVWIGLFKIIWVNLLLSGDNAVVIALASRALPPKQQKQAIIWGSVAAIILRVMLTIFAVQLLEMAWLKGIGAILLVWIGVQLLDKDDKEENIKESSNLFSAIKTILIADLVMSLDNVLAVAAAADTTPPAAKMALVIIGLAMSIPIVIFGSSLVLKLMERFPIIVTLGGMLLGWIAGEMLSKEAVLVPHLPEASFTSLVLAATGALLVLAIGKFREKSQKNAIS